MMKSSAVGKKTVVGFGTLAAVFALTLTLHGAVTNLYDAVAGAGLSLSATSTLVDGVAAGVSKLVNGVTWTADDTGRERVIFSTPTATVNPSVTITVPDEFEAGKRIVLRRVDLYPVTYWGNAKKRMPTAYRVAGVDEMGRETELASVSGQTYPNLGENAAKGECYGLDIPESTIAAARVGWRRFKVEFLDSPSWTAQYSVSLMEVALSVEIVPGDPVARDLYGVQNFSQMIREGGYPINRGGTYDYTLGTNGWSQAANAFDGYTYHLDVSRYGDSFRWLGYMCRPGGFFAALRAPSAFREGDVFIPVACRLWSLSYNSNERVRGPTEFRLSGVADPYDDAVWKVADETTCWTEIEHKSGLDWSNVPYSTKGYNTLGLWTLPVQSEGYRAFRFRPLNSSYYDPNADKIDAGLSEVEIFVLPVNRKGTLRVRADHTGCDFGDGHPVDWALVTTETAVTAPEFVKSAQLGYRVKGYRLETFDYTTLQWVVGDLVEERSYAYVPDAAVSARLVWELEESGCKIEATLMDGGNEKPVTYDPAPEGEPYYPLGTTLTLTAHPNADVLESAAGATNLFRSAFVRWEGDTNGLADVTSPTITFTVDRSRALHPVYRRDWLVYMYDKANEGGSGAEWRLTDGNFDLRCLMMNGLDKHALTFSDANWVRKGYGPLDLSTKMVNAKNGSEVVITTIWWSQLGSLNAPRADFTRVVVPRTLTSLVTTSFRDQTNLVEVVIDCPDLTAMGNCLFTRDTNLKRLVFKAPKLEKITEKYLFFKAMMTETDATDWDLGSLKTLSQGGESRFSLAELTDGYGFHGTLYLPSLETTGWGDFYYQQHVTNVVLGTKKGSLSLLSGYSFNQNKGLASLTIGCTETLEVAQDAFGNCPNLKTITFVKHIPPQAAMDAILVNSSDKNRASVYVSPARSQWTGFLKEIDETKDPNAPAGAVGVYETAEGVRKAWVFYKESPLDPKGAYIILR